MALVISRCLAPRLLRPAAAASSARLFATGDPLKSDQRTQASKDQARERETEREAAPRVHRLFRRPRVACPGAAGRLFSSPSCPLPLGLTAHGVPRSRNALRGSGTCLTPYAFSLRADMTRWLTQERASDEATRESNLAAERGG